MNLEQYQKKLDGKDCKWCRKTDSKEDSFLFLTGLKVKYYPHPAGYKVDGLKGRKWLYVECPKCHYEWSFVKLQIPEDHGD